MKVLIISFRFSPFNSIGTNRIVELVNYLKKRDIEYKVLTSYVGVHKHINFLQDENVIYVPWYDFRKFRKVSFNSYDSKQKKESKKVLKNTILKKVLNMIKQFLVYFLYPDPYICWVVNSIKKRNTILKDYNPEIIYSSSYPYSSHLVAYFFSQKTKSQWYAELRDPWINNHLRKPNWKIMKFFDNILSKKILKKANTIVTVSKIWQDEMNSLYKKKVILIRNGFIDSSIVDGTILDKNIFRIFKNSKKKKILYTGSIFPEFQNIDSFINTFNMDNDLKKKYDFIYVGDDKNLIQQILKKYHYSYDSIFLLEKVSSDTALWMQNNSDLLLLFNWKDNRKTSKGVIPGKFYEYLGANKPIILWNEGIDNELYELSVELNSSHKGDKVLVINEKNNLFQKIDGFEYDSSISKIDFFSRNSQFEILIKDFLREIKRRDTIL